MSQQNKRKQELKTVRGYVVELPSSKRDGSDEEEEDDDDDDNWLDYSQIKNAFSEGTFVKQNKKPRYTRVTLRDLDSGKQTHSCFGRFVLLDPWWEMRVTIGPEKRVQGLTSYCVRQDEDGIVKQNLIPFLLSTALRRYNKHADQLVDQLDTFIKTRGLKKVIFEDIDPLLQQFMQIHPADRHCIMEARRQDTIQGVLRGTRYPDLLQFLCRLFPLTFLSCLLSPMMDTLAGLEKAAETQPWVFGFRAILASRFNVYGIEANFRAFELCGLMEAIPTVQKDALYIYEILKTDAARNGHTYVSFADLREHRHWKDFTYKVDDWGPALTFLAENGVTKEERFDSGRNFFLYHNWKAEVDIADGLKVVMSRGVEAKKPAWDVDFTSEDLSGLRGDGDQWLAAQKVAASPVCIMSGKGGCGKTTVVTKKVAASLVCIMSGKGGCGKTTVVTKVTQHVCQQWKVAASPVCIMSGKGGCGKTTVITRIIQHPPAAEEKMDDVDDLLANAELREAFGAKADRRKPDSASSQPVPAQVTPEELSQMIQTTTQALEESQAQGSRFRISKEKRKRDGIQVDLTTDLIKYLGTTGDTALSRTPNGRKILLTAPTGKAAKLLGHKAKMESCTLHRVIYSYRAFVKEQKKKEMDEKKSRTGWNDAQNQECPAEKNGSPAKEKDIRNNSAPKDHQNEDVTVEEGVWKYARTEVLVVDECSLVSLRLFATMLNILIENTPLWKVVLLGDVRQLPSIEPGNFLVDLFKTFKERGLSVELRTNHRSESELIVSNATRISQRHLPVIDPGRHFHFLAIEDSEHSADPERDAAVRDMLVNRLETHSHETSQFVTFRRVDCDAINELCCQHYNQHTTKEAKASGSKQPYDFRIGDKICFRKNGQVYNQGLKLRAYLQDYPEILGAFGISPMKGGKDTKKENRTMDVTTTAATEQILNGRDEGKEGNLQSAANQHSKEHKDKLHRTLRGATVEQGTSCESLSQPSRASVKQEKLGGEECENGDEWSGEMISSTHSGVKVKQEKKEQGEGTPGSLSASNRPHGVLVKEKKPRGDGDSECFSRYSSADYHIQATDFGITMGHVSQTGDGAGVAMPMTSGCQLRLGDIGAEDCGVSFAGSTPEGSQPSPSQDKDDEEEERAGKLKNGLVRLCNGEVFFIMDDVRERDEKGKELRFLTLSDRDPECPRVVCVSYVALQRECRLRHAWARTIHTYQGSESDTVIYYVGDSRIQNWKHVYTAVTRGRKAVFMVGKDSELRQSVWRGDYPRRSRLSRRLHDMMKGLRFQELHAMMRTVNDQAKDALLLPTTTPPATTPSTQPPPPSLASDPMGGGQPSITTPTSSDVTSKQCVIDPFPDSDDSWVRDMSPVWAADYVASKQNSHGAGRADNPEYPDLYLEDDWDSPPRAAGNMEVENSQGSSPGKQQRLVLQEEQMLSTPKRPVSVKSSDPLDSLISPVRRNLSL
ncbi:hypothetical protein ACOMHN_023558 [Nucella lapillus]